MEITVIDITEENLTEEHLTEGEVKCKRSNGNEDRVSRIRNMAIKIISFLS
jgi:hypothetical protein